MKNQHDFKIYDHIRKQKSTYNFYVISAFSALRLCAVLFMLLFVYVYIAIFSVAIAIYDLVP